ncbi:membrane alanyl aminopeptidase-like [Zophobas morio]|uniref:membrane alanyl aminopeptidase-like n=1 Tax=Zophobas morio TaxID=2755281 RepID=UPI00308270C0
MWRLLCILALVISSEARPKKYAGIPLQKPVSPRASTDNRLDDTLVKPTNYDLKLTVTKDNLENGEFSGVVNIKLNVLKDTNSFVIHAKALEISNVTLTGNKYAGTVTAEDVDANDFVTITGSKNITKGVDYILEIYYTGVLSDTDMDGFYRSNYTDADGNTKYLATTQFEEMGARRAFPCFDEPSFKATFDITITYPNTSTALSNTKQKAKPASAADGLLKVTFDTTPPMSTYLIAFIVSEFECINGTNTADGTPTSVCGRPGTKETLSEALNAGTEALNKMKNFTNIAYGDLGNKKMTQAAIPDFAAGAMENWGLVTYREADLIWDQDQSSNQYQQVVYTVVAHELAHQWFGDYVTLDWWSDIFLNEGFATYFEYHSAAQVQPKWQLEKQFVLEQVQPVLVTDSSKNSKPLSYNTSDPDEIESRFDDISYNKGGTVLKMLQSFLGLENFKNGLNKYLKDHATDVATPDQLWSSFEDFKPEDMPDNVTVVMDNWTKKAGYPVLSLTQDGVNITVIQQRFFSDDGTDATEWYVPITYTTSADTSKFTKTATIDWLKPGENLTITLDKEDNWIILNNQQVGYYRVEYDDTLLAKIKDALNSDNFGKIDEISRSQLVDDQLNFARAGKAEYADVLRFLAFMKTDDSYYTWYPVFNGFSYLLKRTSDDKIRTPLKEYLKELMESLLDSAPFTKENSTEQIYTLKQVLALTWACNLGEENCVNNATAAFTSYTTDDKIPSRNLKSIVYCTGLKNSQNSTSDYEFLYNKYLSTDLATEQVTILKALGCINDATLRQEYLKLALTDKVRIQDVRYVFQSVYSNNEKEGVDDMLKFIKNNYTDFETRFGTQSTLASLISTVADFITEQTQIDTLSEFLKKGDLDDSVVAVGNEAVKSATTNLKTISTLEGKLKDYFAPTSGASINTYHLVNLALIGVVYLFFNFF